MTLEEKFEKWKKDCEEKLKTFEIIGDFLGNSKKIKLKCNLCGHIFEITPYDFKRSKTRCCKECDSMNRKKSRETFISNVKENNEHFNDLIIGEYISKRTKVKCKCKLCGCEFESLPYSLEHGTGCPNCSFGRKKSNKQFINEINERHGKNVIPIEKYVDDSTKILFKCRKCGHTWHQKPRAVLNGRGCPKCRIKHLERDIDELLKNEEVVFQKQFEWLKDKGALFLDFYLPKYNIAIECQGIQHFKPVDFAGKGNAWSNELFLKNLKRDLLKKSLCEKNGVNLIYYTNEKILKENSIEKNIFKKLYNNNLFVNFNDLKKIIYG